MLHVVSGDVAADALREAGLPGDVVGWKDSAATGPSPAVDADAYRRLRAAYRGVDADALQDLRDLDFGLDDDVVLWFDACPFDQAAAWRLLPHVAARARRAWLVEVGAHPDVPRFVGLGQLAPRHFPALFPRRRAVDDGVVSTAARLWTAFCAPDPRALRAALDDDLSALPWSHAAVGRLLQDLPSSWNGLSRTESNLLAAAAEGPATFRDVVAEAAGREEANHGLWYGDVVAWQTLRALARARRPLVVIEDDDADADPSPRARVRVAEAGRRALAGSFDHVVENGVDRWVGGTRLQGPSCWRYDARGAKLVPPT